MADDKYPYDANQQVSVDVDNVPDLETFMSLTSLGSLDSPISNTLYGIDHQNMKNMVPENRDSYGLAFFTRPCLNLTNLNIRNVPKLYDLLTTNRKSIQRFVRCTLDPRLARSQPEPLINLKENFGTGADDLNFKLEVTSSPLVDENMPFIPILTNTLKSMSGWPDTVLPTFTSKEGVRREQWAMGDGCVDFYEAWDMDCTFRNIRDEPLIMMFEAWIRYISMVHEGMMSPYMDFIIENEMDYNTRVYRLVLDESKTFVKKIAATGASFPISVPNGKFFDYEDEEKYNRSTRDINIRFKCMGAEYNQAILVHEFNQTVGIFNTRVWKMLSGTYGNGNGSGLVKIPFGILKFFNNRGYPLINKNTLELEWYVSSTSKRYQDVMQYLQLAGKQYENITGYYDDGQNSIAYQEVRTA